MIELCEKHRQVILSYSTCKICWLQNELAVKSKEIERLKAELSKHCTSDDTVTFNTDSYVSGKKQE